MSCFKKVRGQRSEVRGQRTERKDNSMRRAVAAAIILTSVLCPLSSVIYAQTIVKFATLAPDGSTWMKAMKQFTVETTAKTEGRVKFKIYPGGVSGDEKDVVRKIRLGQLQAAGFTGVGIGEIAPEVRILDTPFLFKNAKEIDHIYNIFDGDFRKIFEARGYILLGWAEVGNVNIFSNSPVTKLEDLKAVKMWIWEGDPIAEATFAALKIKPIPLSITDVMTSLQTGMINGVYGSPLSVIAMQWFSRMKYVLSSPIANASGAVVISKKTFYALTKEDRKTMLELGEKYFRALTAQSRKDNEESVKILKSKKLIFTEPAGMAELDRAGVEARQALVGKLYSKELLEKVETALKIFRKGRS